MQQVASLLNNKTQGPVDPVKLRLTFKLGRILRSTSATLGFHTLKKNFSRMLVSLVDKILAKHRATHSPSPGYFLPLHLPPSDSLIVSLQVAKVPVQRL